MSKIGVYIVIYVDFCARPKGGAEAGRSARVAAAAAAGLFVLMVCAFVAVDLSIYVT